MKHMLISRNFFGGIVGGLLVVLVGFIVSEFKNSSTKSTNAIHDLYVDNKAELPVHMAKYTPQQAVDFTFAAEKSLDAVVHIKTQILSKANSYDDFFGQFQDYLHQYPQQKNSYIAFGSGVIISVDGYIVTNNHLIDGADKITVTFNDERETEAVIIGVDPITDLALLKVKENNLPYLTFGNSDNIRIGEWVLAVGNPFNLNSTVTAGIISAKARNINVIGGQSIESFIQTDAVVNQGNSGGALVNTMGELVGINTAIASHTGVYEGYSFAVPVNIVKKVVADLLEYGEIQRGYLGVQIQDINAEFAEATGLSSVDGIYVAKVMENSGAFDAGIEEGDIILEVNGIETNSLSSLLGIIAQYNPGTSVKVKIFHDDDIINYNVILKNKNGTTLVINSGETFFNQFLGAEFQQVSVDELSQMNISNGLKIVNVDGGIFGSNGIIKGFVIVEINGIRVNSQQNLSMALSKSESRTIRLKGVYPNGAKVSYEIMF